MEGLTVKLLDFLSVQNKPPSLKEKNGMTLPLTDSVYRPSAKTGMKTSGLLLYAGAVYRRDVLQGR